MTRRILITGATGFVGRQILRELAARDVTVTAIVRSGTESRLETAPVVTEVIESPDLFAEGTDWWADRCRSVDTIIHAAWYAEPGKYLQSARNLDCLSGTLELARGAVSAGVRRFVGVGTCFEYDLTAGRLAIDTPLVPASPYAAAKAATYLALSQWLPANGVEFSWCRLFYLHGEGEDERRLVPYLRARLAAGEIAELSRGDQIRDYMDVRDAGRMIADIALGTVQGPVNVCSGVPVTVRQLAEQIADEYGRRDLLRFGARPDNLTDPPRVVGVRSSVAC
jgi:dTDP-6-deoxy-L-talose 4-dehydrogenase (NAD+)